MPRAALRRGFAIAALACFTVGALAGAFHAVTHPEE